MQKGFKSALYKAHFFQISIPADMHSRTEWNYYLNKGMVLLLLRDESLIGKKNTKYLEVMSKLDDGGFSQILPIRKRFCLRLQLSYVQ